MVLLIPGQLNTIVTQSLQWMPIISNYEIRHITKWFFFFLSLYFFYMASCCSSSVLSAETYCLQYAINELFNALNESILNVIVFVP